MATTRIIEVQVEADAKNKRDRLCERLHSTMAAQGDRIRPGWYRVTLEPIQKKSRRRGK